MPRRILLHTPHRPGQLKTEQNSMVYAMDKLVNKLLLTRLLLLPDVGQYLGI